jgi:hypothetical protein
VRHHAVAAVAAAALCVTPAADHGSVARPGKQSRLEVPSLHLVVRLQTIPCEVLWGPTPPPRSRAFLADCSRSHGYYHVVGREDGLLQPLAIARAGTVIHWWDDRGQGFTRTLREGRGGARPNPDGSWPGHGVPPGLPLYIDLRGQGRQTEAQADDCSTPPSDADQPVRPETFNAQPECYPQLDLQGPDYARQNAEDHEQGRCPVEMPCDDPPSGDMSRGR